MPALRYMNSAPSVCRRAAINQTRRNSLEDPPNPLKFGVSDLCVVVRCQKERTPHFAMAGRGSRFGHSSYDERVHCRAERTRCHSTARMSPCAHQELCHEHQPH
jgi:hypothetical protein